MKTSTQLKALIRNISKEKNINPEIILRNYMLERLLERISLSDLREKFILKGGMLVASMVGVDTRSTMDMDATVQGIPFSEESLKEALEIVLSVQTNDNVIMTVKSFETIREESEYPGIRVTIEAVLDKTKQSMKVDFTTGDKITPKAMEYSYKLLLENRNISILSYNLETILAEKLETILSRSTTNTRMRDYYDIYILTTLRANDIDWSVFTNAFRNTAVKRNNYQKFIETKDENIRVIEKSYLLSELWNRYSQKNDYVLDITWKDVLLSLKKLYNRALN